MSYCNVDDVKLITGAKAKHFGYKDNESEFEEVLQGWINQSESLINSYCHNQWEEDIPLAVQNVCIRLTANMIAFHQSRKDNPIKKVNDYTTKIFSSEIFTDDLKQDLKPFIKPKKIKIFRI